MPKMRRRGGDAKDSWDALASKKWVRMEESGRVDDEGRPILEGWKRFSGSLSNQTPTRLR